MTTNNGMFQVDVDLKAGDRTGRGVTLSEALKTVGPLPPRAVEHVQIKWTRGFITVIGAGDSLQTAQEDFIAEMSKLVIIE